jgi:hypothetical protein
MRSVGSGLMAFRRLTWADRALFFEAVAALCVVSAGVRLAPFRCLVGLAARPIRTPRPQGDNARLIRRVRWSVQAASARIPWGTVCLHHSLVAQTLLRRRGVPAVLFYGARLNEARELQAHTWVRVGALDVIGTENADDFAAITCFPDSEPVTPPDRVVL